MFTIIYTVHGEQQMLRALDEAGARKVFRDLIKKPEVGWVQVRDANEFVVARMSWDVEGA
jgi:hypothetical protein